MVGSSTSSMTSYSDITIVIIIITISVYIAVYMAMFTFECEHGGQLDILYDTILRDYYCYYYHHHICLYCCLHGYVYL